VDPEHVPSAERLVELFSRAERWTALVPLLEMLSRKADRAGAGAADAALLYARLGETAQRLGDVDKAVRAYEVAYQLAPRSLPVMRGFAAVRFERREWEAAAALYGALDDAHHAALSPAEVVDVYARLGRCQAEQGDRDGALGWYEKAFALDAGNRPTLEAIAALHADKGDFGALVLDKRTLLGLAPDEETRVALSEEIGDLYRQVWA